MAKITCAISGLSFTCSYLKDSYISRLAGYYHPIFAMSYTDLHSLYSLHTEGKLPPHDSYLLFLAFLHSTDKIEWRVPAKRNPADKTTIALIENNLAQLIAVVEKSNTIRHPEFSQPEYVVTKDSANLAAIPNYISEWELNITDFLADKADQNDYEKLKKVENKLSKLILSGINPKEFSGVIASWACKTADFPKHKAEAYMKIIRSCFNTNKMFNTPLADIKEVKNYCECNIEAGSIHFHTLEEVLTEGISKNVNYLGDASDIAKGYSLLGTVDTVDVPIESIDTLSKSIDVPSDGAIYANASRTLLPKVQAEIKGALAINSVIAKAPTSCPKQADYPDSISFLKAKLAYRSACNAKIGDTGSNL